MARIKSKTVVVCDAGPVIHLDEIGCLHAMNDFSATLHIEPSLLEEVVLQVKKRIPVRPLMAKRATTVFSGENKDEGRNRRNIFRPRCFVPPSPGRDDRQ